jgi:hypothetical protein
MLAEKRKNVAVALDHHVLRGDSRGTKNDIVAAGRSDGNGLLFQLVCQLGATRTLNDQCHHASVRVAGLMDTIPTFW